MSSSPIGLPNWFTGNSANCSIGPSITLPLFQGGTNLARLDSEESRHVQILENYRQTILQAFREIADLLTSLHARAEQLAGQREQLSAALEAVRLADVRYRKGLVTYLDVLDAQRTTLTAETQLVLTEHTRLTDMVSLFKERWEEAGCRHPPETSPDLLFIHTARKVDLLAMDLI